MLNTEDRLAIHEILALYAHIVDSFELDRLDELFTPYAVYDLSAVGIGAYEGIAAIRAAAARMAESGHSPLAHYVTNIVIRSSDDDDEATAQSKGLMIMDSGAIQGVTHDDTLRRHHGSWRISRRIITPVRPATAVADHEGVGQAAPLSQ